MSLDLPRTAIVQIKARKRSVSTLELTKFARLYGRPVAAFLDEAQVVHLALEAYRREEISQGKLRDLSALLDVPAEELLLLADEA